MRLLRFCIFNLLLTILVIIPYPVSAVDSCAEHERLIRESLLGECRNTDLNDPTEEDYCTRYDRGLGQQLCEFSSGRNCFPRSGAVGFLCELSRQSNSCTGLCPTGGLAQNAPTPSEPELTAEQVLLPRLQIDVPGLQPFTKPRATQEGEQVFLNIDFIGQYIIGLYKYLVGIVGILTGVIYTWAGFRWITSGGDPEKISEAKKRIAGATMGLVLTLGAYLVLYLVNPALTIFQPLRIEYIKRVPLETPEESDESYDAAAATFCPGADELQTVPRTESNLGLRTGKDLLLPEAGQALLQAARIAAQRGYGFWICSAGRTLEEQQRLWDSAVRQHGSEEVARRYVARPRCGAPHLTGRTVDLTLWSADLSRPLTGDGCTKRNISAANAAQTTAEQRTLESIMFAAGWRRYCGEWWHFEFGTPRAQRAGSNPCAN